ncbi:MAG: peptidylprolyl isomerase [Verrucomicrobiaceae bacterium]|nr:MAG: peptidylprolyl isomerase [Verrucomicrobiaceae bacterium]
MLAAPLHAELLATFQTTRGNVVVELQYDKAPQAVGNFITLSQGTRSRITANGAVTNAPLYVGEKFFRVVNGPAENPAFKIAQTGSGTGINSGGPGYVFRDEFDPALTHVPYVLSMANNGVHTNGSQIFFTGNGSILHLDNMHTIFGLVTDPASRTVIDDIIGAGNDATTINAVTISRTDPDAVAFDEFEQDLPECQPVPGHLEVIPATKADYLFNDPLKPGTVLQCYRSPDLTAWTRLGERYHGTGQIGFSSAMLDSATLPKAFYNLSMVTYPDALAPASFANRAMLLDIFGNQTLLLEFNASGTAGIATYSQEPGNPTAFQLNSYTGSAYAATLVIQSSNLGSLRIRAVLDGEKELHILGTHNVDQYNGLFWQAATSGGLTLTK